MDENCCCSASTPDDSSLSESRPGSSALVSFLWKIHVPYYIERTPIQSQEETTEKSTTGATPTERMRMVGSSPNQNKAWVTSTSYRATAGKAPTTSIELWVDSGCRRNHHHHHHHFVVLRPSSCIILSVRVAFGISKRRIYIELEGLLSVERGIYIVDWRHFRVESLIPAKLSEAPWNVGKLRFREEMRISMTGSWWWNETPAEEKDRTIWGVGKVGTGKHQKIEELLWGMTRILFKLKEAGANRERTSYRIIAMGTFDKF